MKKQIIITLGAVMLLSGCNGKGNKPPEESEVSITESVTESTNESETTEITAGSEDISVLEPDRDMTVTSTENEMKEQISSDSAPAYNESEHSQIASDDTGSYDTGSYENKDSQESETVVYTFGDYLERDND